MKNALAAILATVALATTVLFAQKSGTTFTPPSPADLVARRVNSLTTLLTLTSSQQQQATTIFTNAITAESAVLTNLRTARQGLLTAVQNNDTNSISQIATTIGNLTAQLTSLQANAEAAFYQTLTADQQAKFNELESHGPGMFPGLGPGPGAGPGPRPFPRGH